jgi:CubicO group peptidase (beta-lactamase class C family)
MKAEGGEVPMASSNRESFRKSRTDADNRNDRGKSLDPEIVELMRKGMIPGLQVALIEQGRLASKHGFGIRNSSTGQPVTNETVFEAASLGKPVFAYGALKLIDQGALELDAPLSEYLPGNYSDTDERLKEITCRHVLSHRSGLPNWREKGKPLTIQFPPGERFSYSGEGFVYLQIIVEGVTGKALNDYMSEAVFRPLGMKSSSYVWRAGYDACAATGHDATGNPCEKYKPTESNVAGSLHTTAEDYALFVEAVLNGVGLDQETLFEMERPQVAVGSERADSAENPQEDISKGIFWGLGWGIAKVPDGEALWHWGNNQVFQCFAAAFPQSKNGMVAFANSENGLLMMARLLRLTLGIELPVFRWMER